MNANDVRLIVTLIPIETWNTIYMVLASTLAAIVMGLPLGIILVITEKGGIKQAAAVNICIGAIVNVGRSFPFIILMIALIPFTRFVVGTSLGTNAAIVPLSIAAAPFVARVVETSLKEISHGVIEAAQACGCSTWQIIYKVLLPEAMPSMVLGATLTIINLISYSAMAGAMGGGGLGKVAIQYGYNRYETPLMIATVVVLIILVQIVQLIGNHIARRINRK